MGVVLFMSRKILFEPKSETSLLIKIESVSFMNKKWFRYKYQTLLFKGRSAKILFQLGK